MGTNPVHSTGRPGPRDTSNLTTEARPRLHAAKGRRGSQERVSSSPEVAVEEAMSPSALHFDQSDMGRVERKETVTLIIHRGEMLT